MTYEVLANGHVITQRNILSKLLEHKCSSEHSLRNIALRNQSFGLHFIPIKRSKYDSSSLHLSPCVVMWFSV